MVKSALGGFDLLLCFSFFGVQLIFFHGPKTWTLRKDDSEEPFDKDVWKNMEKVKEKYGESEGKLWRK